MAAWPIPIAIVGVGKIARDQHVPAIAANPDFRLVAAVSRSGGLDGVENLPDLPRLLADRPDVAAVALCMPPQARFLAAKTALSAGRHVLLEKPPGATVAEVHALAGLAERTGVALYATWHSRHAAGVAAARQWLDGRRVLSGRVTWHEDVRKWHPGQEWIWTAGAMGVFDPGINALSILTEILPVPVRLTAAELDVPANRETPIAARLTFADADGARIDADFDWRTRGEEIWEIALDTDAGPLRLSSGGADLSLGGTAVEVSGGGEYPAIYARFTELVATGARDVDVTPLVHVADAFMLGRRMIVPDFLE